MEIARKIGLPEDVIADASAKVGSDYIDMDKYLQDIVRDKRYWEGKRQTIRQKEKKLEELTETYEADLQKIAKERKELMANAKLEATRILADANATIENTIRKIKEASAEKEATRDARKELDAFKAQLLTIESNGDDVISHKIKKIQDREERNKLIVAKPLDKKAFQPDVILVGDAVRLKGQNTVGEVLELQGKQVTVAFGMLKSTVLIDRLDKISKNQLKKESHKTTFVSKQTASDISERRLNFRSEIDVRGMRGDEALQAVVYFIDDAIMVGMGQVRILHGTGTGALRQIIRQYLQTVHGVKSIRDEHVQMGGTGITVVELD
jgi:DNA mismatch repair protein MutS2